MLDIKLLNKIKPGDEVLYDYFWEGNEEWHEVLKVARRSGFDENGNIDLDAETFEAFKNAFVNF